MSLFGVGALEPVVDAVVTRMGELTGMEQLARSVTESLRSCGVMGVAHADIAKPCPQAENYTCLPEGQPSFTGCDYGGNEFRCEWGPDFACEVADDKFACETSFTCPPWVAGTPWFACSTYFDCDYPNPFECSDGEPAGSGYLCPDSTQFAETCLDETPRWQCPTTGAFGRCPGQTDPYECEDGYNCGDDNTVIFRCGPDSVDPDAKTFECDDITDGGFVCSDGTVYDFDCRQGFICGGNSAENGLFDCNSGHAFMCAGDGDATREDFICTTTTFTCGAGGTRCGEGMTGQYTVDQPGDFLCINGAKFQCSNAAFTCTSEDEFMCGQINAEFWCTAPFGGCATVGASFTCEDGVTFVCFDHEGEEFDCAEDNANRFKDA